MMPADCSSSLDGGTQSSSSEDLLETSCSSIKGDNSAAKRRELIIDNKSRNKSTLNSQSESIINQVKVCHSIIGTKVRKRRRRKKRKRKQDDDDDESMKLENFQMLFLKATTTELKATNQQQQESTLKIRSQLEGNASKRPCCSSRLLVSSAVLLLLVAFSSAAQSTGFDDANKMINSNQTATSQSSSNQVQQPLAASSEAEQQEVDLLNGPPKLLGNNNNRPPIQRARGSRIYRIRAAPQLNGKFGGPLRIVVGSAETDGELSLPSSLDGSKERTSGKLVDIRPQFGARSSPATNLRIKQVAQSSQQQQQQPVDLFASSSSTKSLFSQQPIQQQPISVQFPCNQSAISGDQQQQLANANELAERSSSIAATSQTLLLLAPSTASQQQQHHRQLVEAPKQQQRQHNWPRTGGEIDESESISSPNGRPAAAPQNESGSTGGQQQQRTEGGTDSSPTKISTPLQSSSIDAMDSFDSKIVTNRTKAQLSCDSGEMIIRLNFTEPFKGIVYPDHNRLSPCRFFGDGHHNYELRLPLRGCGTRQVAPRIFVNDVIVRFHKTLELEEDEVKTLICRYPPPQTTTSSGSNIDGQQQFNGLVQELDQLGNNNFNQNQRLRQPPTQFGQQQQQFELLLNPTVAGGGTPQNGFSHHPGNRSPSSRIISSSSAAAASNLPGLSSQQGQVEILSSQLAPSFNANLSPASQASSSYDFAPSPGGAKSPHQPSSFLQQPNRINSGQKNANIVAQPPNSDNNDAIVFGGSGSIQEIGSGGVIQRGQSGSSSFFDRLSSIELLFLISSLMFLVLLAFGLLGTYYCFHRRRRRQSAPSAGAILRRKRRYLGGSGSPSGAYNHHHDHSSSLHATPLATGGSSDPLTTHQPILYRHHHNQQPPPARHQLHHQHNRQMPQQSLIYQQQQQHHLNAPSSSSPESNISDQVLIPAAKSSSRMAPATYHQHPSLYKPALPTTQYDQPAADYHHQAVASSFRNQRQPVLGRRETIYSSNGPALGRAQQQHQQQPTVSTLGRRRQMQQQQQHPPTANQLPLLQIAKELPAGQKRDPVRDLLGKDEYALARAKSLQQLNNLHHSLHSAAATDQQQISHPTASGGWRSLSRDGLALSTGDKKQADDDYQKGGHQGRRRHESAPRPQPTTAYQQPSSRSRPFGFRSSRQKTDGQASSSDSEIEPSNENKLKGKPQIGGEDHAPTKRTKPRIYLKSIEDRFVTNITEINKQEYFHRDSRKPISWAQWKSMQPPSAGAAATSNYKTPTSDTNNQRSGDGGGDKQRDTVDQGREQQQHQGQSVVDLSDDDEQDRQSNSGAKFRSLTELDVNFAKTLRINPSAAAKPRDDNTNRESPSTSVKQATQQTTHAGTSPDLIISPDYELHDTAKNHESVMTLDSGESTRIKRLLDSPKSTNSVSYV